jgi:hypothetical protein
MPEESQQADREDFDHRRFAMIEHAIVRSIRSNERVHANKSLRLRFATSGQKVAVLE